MMIGVGSYPELFSTLLGWQQYQNLWDIITQTGLIFVPFILMIIRNTTEPFLSQEAKSAYTISLRRVEYAMATMILTIMIACQPMITLDPQVLKFEPLCDQSVNASPGQSGTTYDQAFGDLTPVKVPLWWVAVMGVSHGLTAAATVSLGCQPNLREVEMQLDLTRIQNAPMQSQVQGFLKACYLPAYRKYVNAKPKADMSAYTQKYGEEDLSWMGSEAFQHTPGYYDAFRAPYPIEGFAYDSSKDWAQGSANQIWGTPNCADWWSAPKNGLHDQLQAQISPSLWNNVESYVSGQPASDYAIKKLIQNSPTSGYQENTNFAEQVGGIGTATVAGVGNAMNSFSFFPKMYSVIESLPLIQAYLLMASYIFLALALVASGFKFRTVLSLTFVIFSIIFWSYLWQLAEFIDNSMIKALSPPGGFQGASKHYGGTPVLTDMVAIMMYVAVPFFWTMFMGWAGVKAGSGVDSIVDRASGVGGSASPLSLLGSVRGRRIK